MATDTESETINDYTEDKLSRNNSISSIHNLSEAHYDENKNEDCSNVFSPPNTPTIANSTHPQFIPISHQDNDDKSDSDSHIIHQNSNHNENNYQLKELDDNDDHPMEVIKRKKVTKIISRTTTINGIPQETETQEYTLHDSHNHELIPISTRRSDRTSCKSDITEKQDKENLSDINSPTTKNHPNEDVDEELIQYSNYDRNQTEVDDLVCYETYDKPKQQRKNESDESDVDLINSKKPQTDNNGYITDGSVESDEIKPIKIKSYNESSVQEITPNCNKPPSVPPRHKYPKKSKPKPRNSKSKPISKPDDNDDDENVSLRNSKRTKSPTKYPTQSLGTSVNYQPIDIINHNDVDDMMKARNNQRYFSYQDLTDNGNDANNNDSEDSKKSSLKWRDPLKSNHLKYDDKNKDLYDWIKAKRLKLLSEKRDLNSRSPVDPKPNNKYANGHNENGGDLRNSLNQIPYRDKLSQTRNSAYRLPIENGFRKSSLSPTRHYSRENVSSTQKSLISSLDNRRTKTNQNYKPINGSTQRQLNPSIYSGTKTVEKEKSRPHNLNNSPSSNNRIHPTTRNSKESTTQNLNGVSNNRSYSPTRKSKPSTPNTNNSYNSPTRNNKPITSPSPNKSTRNTRESNNELKVELYKILDRFDSLEKKLEKQNNERTKSPSILSTTSSSVASSIKTPINKDNTPPPSILASASPSTSNLLTHHLYYQPPVHCFCCQCHICCMESRHHHHNCHTDCHKHHYAWCENYVPLSCTNPLMASTKDKNLSLVTNFNTNRSIDSGYQPSRLNSLRSSARFSSLTRPTGSLRSSIRSNSLRRNNSFSANRGILGY